MNKIFREKHLQNADYDTIDTSAALFRSLSHDLRNPVSSIINASSFYLSGTGTLDDNKKTSLVQHMNDDSIHLLDILENILVVSKLYNTAVPFSTSLESLEEVISSAITRLKLRFPAAVVHAKIPAEVLLVPMDSILIQLALITLMKTLLTVCGTQYPLECTLMKKDSSAIFHLNSNNPLKESSALTDDIDIAVCKLIINAHKGSFSCSLMQDCSSYKITLPLGGLP